MIDLPRIAGTSYGLKSVHTGRICRVNYAEAYLAWKKGDGVYTKNCIGTRAEVHERPWVLAAPNSESEI